jgi:hypothetical protein
MHIILAKAIADVDAAYFERVGIIDSMVMAVPTIDQCVAIKGAASHPLDNETECQNTLFLTYEPTGWTGDYVDFSDALEPGCLYKYIGELAQFRNEYFAELKYEYQLGHAKLIAYFLVPGSDCEFAINDEQEGVLPYTLPELWKDGYIKRIDHG